MRTKSDITLVQNQYCQILNEEYRKRKSRNSEYSLRAFASQLGISASLLSQILNARKPLTLALAKQILPYLKLEKNRQDQFLKLVKDFEIWRNNKTLQKEIELKEKFDYQALHDQEFSVIKHWYFFAILNIVGLDDPPKNCLEIAKRLGISIEECEEAIQILKHQGLLTQKNSGLLRTKRPLEISSKIPNQDIQSFHTQNIHRALSAISEFGISQRDISSITMPVDTSRLAEAKIMIQNFRRELSDFLKSGPTKKEVYSLNIQLFPQTRLYEKQERK